MSEGLIALIASGSTAAVISGIFSIILYKIKKKDKEKEEDEDRDDVVMKALRYIMLYIIQERAKDHISHGKITVEERRSLHKWHELYHNGLNGNGDADLQMEAIDQLDVDYN